MELNFVDIKSKILEETKEEVKQRQAKIKRKRQSTYYILFSSLLFVLFGIMGWANWYIIPLNILVVIIGIKITSETDVFTLENVILEKKNKILEKDEYMISCLHYLKNETTKAILAEYDFYSTSMRDKNEVKRVREALRTKIENSFSSPKNLISFNSSFTDLNFKFSLVYDFIWGDASDDYTRMCKVEMYEDYNELYFHSWNGR